MERLPISALQPGFCHGDASGGNAHISGRTITFFDFDCCGCGFRAYDVAVYLSNSEFRGPEMAARRWREYSRLPLATHPR